MDNMDYKTLTDGWKIFARAIGPLTPTEEAKSKGIFYAGAVTVFTALRNGAHHLELFSEIGAYSAEMMAKEEAIDALAEEMIRKLQMRQSGNGPSH